MDEPDLTPEVEIAARSCQNSSDPLCYDSKIELPKNLTVVTWSLKNVSAAFMDIRPYPYEEDPFAYTAFIGDPDSPYLGKKATLNSSGIAAALLASPLKAFDALDDDISDAISDDADALPFNYCKTRTSYNGASCYTSGQDPLNYLSIFFPLRKGETSRSGKWLMSIGNDEHGFLVFYRGALGAALAGVAVTNEFTSAN